MSIRLGIIGTGRIAGRFAVDGWQGLDVKLCAAYNPREKSARDYAKKYELPFGTGHWEEFTDKIDAAYIASPTPTHGDYIRALLEQGKHALCEKPLVLKEEEARELFELAKRNNLVLMEAVKTAYCPGFKALLQISKQGLIGEIRDVEACFTKLTDPQGRELTDRAYGGSMTELGTYGGLAVLKLLGADYEELCFSVQRNREGIDIFTKCFVSYRGGQPTGLIKSGLGVKAEGELIISGTKGYILVRAPWWLTRHFEARYENPDKRELYDYPFEGNGLQYELSCFLNRVRGIEEEECVTPHESIRLAAMMETFLKEEEPYRKQTQAR